MLAARAPVPVSQIRLEMRTVAPFTQRVTDKQASIPGPPKAQTAQTVLYTSKLTY